ncbi:MAG: hypothetical protein K9I85_03750 [Saprospiraceae bacterium]|nr:hypothetical protein [Saprospiraceae bacterium]
MKSILVLFSLIFTAAVSAQEVPVTLKFQHTIADEALAQGEIYSSIQGNFMVTRLSYYLSGIELIHDGGQRFAFDDLYLLVHGFQDTYDLGMADIQEIEGIAFSIGVDSVTNHADPAEWPASHPLSFQSPSMHWGWLSGYRFLAIEGLLDNNQDGDPEKVWEFHVVGDELLTHVEVMLDEPQSVGVSAVVLLHADYLKLFDQLSMDNILHGSGSIVTKMMGNWNKGPVFTALPFVTSTENQKTVNSGLQILGNPTGHIVRVRCAREQLTSQAMIRIMNMTGNLITQKTVGLAGDIQELSIPGPGTYQVILLDQDRVLGSQLIISQ